MCRNCEQDSKVTFVRYGLIGISFIGLVILAYFAGWIKVV